MSAQVTEADLHGYVEGVLSSERRIAVEAHIAAHPEEALRLRAWQEQNQALHAAFDPVLSELLPASTRPRPWFRHIPFVRYAAVAGLLIAGGIAGWYSHAYNIAKSADGLAFARRAAVAHVVYTPEVRHPVEVGADQEAHLVAWLSKRLGAAVKVPHLGQIGYQLVGGRLLPGEQGPVAQFMFQSDSGQRLTLYVRTGAGDSKETAFRYAQERGISVFYWIDGKFGYALSGETDKAELLRVARAVYQQLNP